MPLVLRSAGAEVVCVDQIGRLMRRAAVLPDRLGPSSAAKVGWDRSLPVLRGYARLVEAAQRRHRADVILVGESPLVALADVDAPVVTWTDAVFDGLVEYYPGTLHLTDSGLRRGSRAERLALSRASAAVFLSEWAASQAREIYDIPTERTHVIPFGGVLDSLPDSAEVLDSVLLRSQENQLRLLWMGRDWYRKGGDIAFETAEELRARGHAVRLTIIGLDPPEDVRACDWVDSLGTLRRSSTEERHLLTDAFLASHVHLLPTRAECMGLGLAEASAHAVPSVATDTGGTSSAVIHGTTGLLVPENSNSACYADAVERIAKSPEEFMRFAGQARRDYDSRLSYPVTGQRLLGVMEKLAG
jgi:glycosyltransferase involved in cell wall biosynthesis